MKAKPKNLHVERILKHLNDPCIKYVNGKLRIKWECYTMQDVQKTLSVVIDCFFEMGYFGRLYIEIPFRMDGVLIKYTDSVNILQFPKHETCRSYNASQRL